MAQRQDMMSMMMPYIIARRFEKKRIEDYLQKSLTEYEAYGKIQKDLQDRAIINKLNASLMDPDMFKEYPYQAYTYATFLKEMLPPDITKQLNIPEKYEDMIALSQEATARSLQSVQEKKPLPEEDITSLVRGYGQKAPFDMIKQVQKILGEEAGREVQRDQQEIDRQTLKVREGELTAKKKGETGKAKLKEDLLNLGKKEKIFADKLKEIEAYSLEAEEGDEFKKVEADLEKVRGQRLDLINQLVGELDKPKVDGILAKLKKGGATSEGLESQRAAFMKAEGLTDIEFEYLKIHLGR